MDTLSKGRYKISRFMVVALVVSSHGLGLSSPAIAQISSDGALPDPTTVETVDNLNFTITNGTQVGSNLFHSFSQFSIPTRGVANFNTLQYGSIQNIFSRVTGGTVSSLDGTLRITGTAANFFLLNPNGIIFGPNASLDVGGSFLATTGSSIRFADGTEFNTNAQRTPTLTLSVPIGVQFGANPGTILVSGSGLSTPNQTFGLLGGDIVLEGGINGLTSNSFIEAPGGRLELGSVAGTSLVTLSEFERGYVLGYNQTSGFQDIRINPNILLFATDGGSMQVQGRQVKILGGSQLSTSNSATARLPGGSLIINGSESVEILGTGFYNGVENPSGLFNRNRSAQSAGEIRISTKTLRITDGGRISGETFGVAQGGNIVISASSLVDVQGVSTTNPVDFFSTIIVASRATSNTLPNGNAGNLTIDTNRLAVSRGGQVSATTFGNGQGGNINVNAETIQLTGGSTSQVNGLFAQSGSSVPRNNNPNATGQGGNLTINAASLFVDNGARISTSTFTAGNAGNLTINANTVQVNGRSLSDGTSSLITASSAGRGAAGNLGIVADQVRVQDGGQITVSGTSTGVAGNLNISAPFIELNNQGVLLAETRAGQGNITLDTRDLRLRNNSLISTNATGAATGGNIRISTQTLVALENSDITANAQESFGGRVSIRATAIFGTQFRPFLTPESDITATSALGPDFSGAVILQTPGIDPSQGLLQLQTDVVDVSRLVIAACSPTNQQATGEFFVTGRGGLPASPSDTVNDDRVLVDLGSPARDRVSNPTPNPASPVTPTQSPKPVSKTPLLQAQGWVVNESGKVVLVAQSASPPASRVSNSLFPACK